MRSLLILILGLMAVSAFPYCDERIIGGCEVTIYDYPEMASLLFSYGTIGHRQACAGSILNNRSIVTVAHCIADHPVYRWLARLGSSYANSGGEVYRSTQFIIHPSYDRQTLDNDIAIIRVNREIVASSAIRFGRYAGPAYNIADNEIVWIAGWGKTSEGGPKAEVLHDIQIWTINFPGCQRRFTPIDRVLTQNMLCAGWLDIAWTETCEGDNGGPLLHNGVIVGIRSWAVGCGVPRYPSVYTRVQRFATWLEQNR